MMRDEKIVLPDRYIKRALVLNVAQKNNTVIHVKNVEEPIRQLSKLLIPISVISRFKPIKKKTEHLFLKLSNYEEFLNRWLTDNRVQKEN